MSTQEQAAQLRRERELRFVDYIKQGLPNNQIEVLEGISTSTAASVRSKVAKEFGLKVSVQPGARPPIGLEPSTVHFRVNLAGLFEDFKKNKSTVETGRALSMSGTEQLRAAVNHHNWTLIQLDKLASGLGLTFTQLIAIANAGPTGWSDYVDRKKKR